MVALLCAIGLGSTPADLTFLLRRPALLFRSLFAMYVAIPLAALAIVQTVPLPPGVRMAILVLAISAGAPLLPRKLMTLGREGYVFSLVVLSSLLAVVAVPAWLVVLGPYFARESAGGAARGGPPGREGRPRAHLRGNAPPAAAWRPRGPCFRVGAEGRSAVVLVVAGVALLAMNARLLIAAGWVALLTLAGSPPWPSGSVTRSGGRTARTGPPSRSRARRGTSASRCSRHPRSRTRGPSRSSSRTCSPPRS